MQPPGNGISVVLLWVLTHRDAPAGAGEVMDTTHLLPPAAAIKEPRNGRAGRGDGSSPAPHLTKLVHLHKAAGAASHPAQPLPKASGDGEWCWEAECLC